MRPNVKKGNVLITGASSGIGKAAALMLDQTGYTVIAGVRTGHSASELKRNASERLMPIILDITQQEDVDRAYQVLLENCDEDHPLDALINNAGFTEAGPLECLSIKKLKYQMEVNLFGHFSMIQKILPLIRDFRSRIINIGSPAGFSSPPFIGAYSMSKHAFKAMNDTFRHELRSFGIHVIMVYPGFVETPIWNKSYLEMDRLIDNLEETDRNRYLTAIINGRRFMDVKGRAKAITPDMVANKILCALEDIRPKSNYFVGIDSYIALYLEKFVPKFLLDKMTERVLEGKF